MNPSEIVTIVIVMAALAAWSLYGFMGAPSASQSRDGRTVLKGPDIHQPFQTDADFKQRQQTQQPSHLKNNVTAVPIAPTTPVHVSDKTNKHESTPSSSSSQQQPQVLHPNPDNIVNYTTNDMEKVLGGQFFKGGLCAAMKQGANITSMEEYRRLHTLVNISFNCHNLYKNSGLGTGNYISAFYGLRMAAQAMGMTDVSIQCEDAEETKKELLLPWVMGMFPALTDAEKDTAELPELSVACSDYKNIPIGYKWNDMRYEWRRMAIAMVGIPSSDHPAAAWAEENLWKDHDDHRHGRNYMELVTPHKGDTPLYPDVEVDDAMLHFRCGDIISSNHPSFGFMKFGSFSRHLSPDVRSIGIATQPFNMSAQMRRAEGGAWKQERCKKVVMAFVEHLQGLFPKARIRIHNGLNETIALTFARMIMANQTVIGITSFGVFPGVTTFGTGYIRKPDYMKAPNRWLLTSPLIDRVDNVKLIEEPRMMAIQCKRKWGEDDGASVLEWFRNYTIPANF